MKRSSDDKDRKVTRPVSETSSISLVLYNDPLLNADNYKDVKIKIGDVIFEGCKAILGSRSKVLHTMFQNDKTAESYPLSTEYVGLHETLHLIMGKRWTLTHDAADTLANSYRAATYLQIEDTSGFINALLSSKEIAATFLNKYHNTHPFQSICRQYVYDRANGLPNVSTYESPYDSSPSDRDILSRFGVLSSDCVWWIIKDILSPAAAAKNVRYDIFKLIKYSNEIHTQARR
jgi:hypothetical protein